MPVTDFAVKANDETLDAFFKQTAKDAPDEKLEKWICGLAVCSTKNDNIKTSLIIRALAINHLQMSNVIAKLNRKNSFVLWLTFSATFVCTIVGIINIWLFITYKP